MVVDAVRSYFDAASGLTELTRKRAVAAAKTLLKSADDRAAGQRGRSSPQAEDVNGAQRASRVGHDIQSLASELIETSQANRAALGALVESEVSRVIDRLDLVPRDEYERVVRRVAELERRVATQRVAAPSPAQAAGVPVQPASTEVPASTERSIGDGSEEPPAEPGAAETTDVTDRKTTTDSEPVGADADSDATSVKGGESAAPSEPVEDSATHASDQTDRGGIRSDHADQDDGPHPRGEKDQNEQEAPPEAGTAPLPDTGAKSTRTSSKQAGSKTTSKPGKSKGATKRSGARTRTTAPVKKSEQ